MYIASEQDLDRWAHRFDKRMQPEWVRRRRVTLGQMRPRKRRDHEAARLVRGRRRVNHVIAQTASHVRGVAREGDEGLRCPDCHHIPFKPWESTELSGPNRACCEDSTVGALTCAVK